MADQPAGSVDGPGGHGGPGGRAGSGTSAGPGSPTSGGSPRRFEDLLAELEAVTDRLAGGEVGIEEAADLYERAQRLHQEASARLEAVRTRVESLREPPAPGGRAE